MSKLLSNKHGFPPGKPVTGHIGIFWSHNGNLFAFDHAVDKGQAVAGTVDSNLTHSGTWWHWQERHVELRDLGYEEVPRGRVVYVQSSNRFLVFMDKVLFKPHIKASILSVFKLPKMRTAFFTDPHYTTDPAELERLFGHEQGFSE